MPSQSGYFQDIINERLSSNIDVVIALFRHSLGSPSIDPATGNVRAESGTVEELMSHLEEVSSSNLCMLYYYKNAPKIPFDSPDFDWAIAEWKRLGSFKNKVNNKFLWKLYDDEQQLLETVLGDLRMNIIDWFE